MPRFEAAAAAAAWAVGGLGLLVLIGWAFGLPALTRLGPRMIAMKANTALGFVLIGASLWLARRRRAERKAFRIAGRSCAAMVAVIGLLSLSEYMTQANLRIDQLLVRDTSPEGLEGYPGRLALNTAVSFVLLGLALLLVDAETRGRRRPAEFLAGAVGMASLMALVGYAYGVAGFYSLGVTSVPMAANTALALGLSALGVFLAQPDRGLMAVVTEDQAGGLMMRRLLLPLLTFPIVLDLSLRGARATGLIPRGTNNGLQTVLLMLAFVSLLWVTAKFLNQADAARGRQEAEVRRLNVELEQRVLERTAELTAANQELSASRAAALHMMEDALVERKRAEQANASLREEATARYQAEAALRQSEDKFRYVFDHSLIGKSLTLPSGEMQVNTAFCEMLGWSQEEFSKRKWKEITHPDDAEESQRIIDSIVSGESSSARFTKRYLHKNGSVVWAELGLTLRRDAEGKPLYLLAAVNDITERRRADVGLRRLASIVESSDDAIISKDLDGTIRTWNPAAARMFGYQAEEVIGRNITLLIPEDCNEEEAAILGKVRKGEYVQHYEAIRIKKDGTPLAVSLTISPVRDASGTIVGASKIVRDISERKRGEEALRLAHQRLRRFVDSNIVGIVIANAAGDIIEANDYYLRLIGFTREELNEGKIHWRAITPPRWVPADEQAIQELRERGSCTPYEKEYVRRDGTHVPVYLADALLAGPEEQIAAFVLDFTALKRAEADVRRLNTELEQRVHDRTAQLEAANKELEAFCYSVSHDLRAPLRHIAGFANRLAKDAGPGLGDKSRHYLAQIVDSAGHMGCLIDDLLTFSRMGRVELRRGQVDLGQLVNEAIKQLQPETSGREIQWQQEPMIEVQADAAMLRQVVLNLLSNAVKYTRPRRPAEIEIGCDDTNPEETVVYAGQRSGFRHGLCGQPLRGVPTAPFGRRVRGHGHRLGQRAAHYRPAWRPDLGRRQAQRGRNVLFLITESQTST